MEAGLWRTGVWAPAFLGAPFPFQTTKVLQCTAAVLRWTNGQYHLPTQPKVELHAAAVIACR